MREDVTPTTLRRRQNRGQGTDRPIFTILVRLQGRQPKLRPVPFLPRPVMREIEAQSFLSEDLFTSLFASCTPGRVCLIEHSVPSFLVI